MVTDKQVEEFANKVLTELNSVCHGMDISVHYDVLSSLWLMFHIMTNPDIRTAKSNLKKQEEFIVRNWIHRNTMLSDLKSIQ